MKQPCHECNNRVLGCHSTCNLYKEWNEYNKKLKEAKHRCITKWKAGYYHDCK